MMILRKTTIRFSAKFFLFLSAAGLIAACNKPSELGLGVQPDQDGIGVNITDTVALTAVAISDDSMRTDETSLNLLGSYVDPDFGMAKAGFYAEARMPSSAVDFGSTPVLDSIVLNLAHDNYYGDTASVQNVQVFELDERIYKDSTYYSNQVINTIPTALAETLVRFSPTDSVLVDGQKIGAHLRIRLDAALGNNILAASGTSTLADNESWLEFFKGIYVTVNNPAQVAGEGAILYFNLLSSLSNITVYYKNATDTTSYAFEFNSNATRINHFEHDHQGSTVDPYLSGSAPDTNKIFVQAMAGVKTKIEIPYIGFWQDTLRMGINKAEVLLTVDQSSNMVYQEPDQLILIGIGDEGQNIFIGDQLLGEAHYGGFLDEDTYTYRFNIGKHLQEIQSGTATNNGLYLLVSGAAVKADRVILGGTSLSGIRIQLIVTYTLF